MKKMITCTSVSIYQEALTRGQQYEVLDEDTTKQQVKIRGDNGRVRWFPMTCFDLEGRPVAVMVRWQFDNPIENEFDDWVEVSFDLSDGTRRWCSFVTPDRLKRLLDQQHAEPGYWSTHMILVRSLTPEVIERMLRVLDQKGKLLDASVMLRNTAARQQ